MAQSSKPQRGLGLMLQDVDDKIVVRQVRPDSIAAASKAIEPGDRLVAISIGDVKTSLKNMTSRDVRRLLQNATFDQPVITLTIQRADSESSTDVPLRRSTADIESDLYLYRVQIEAPTSLSEAVKSFNEKTKHHSVGRSQPPLTVDEIVGAIVRRKHADKNTNHPRLEEIADTRLLKPGEELSFIPSLVSHGYHFTVWWIDLRVDGHGLRIRDRTLSSRDLTKEELDAHQRFHEQFGDQLKKRKRTQPSDD